MYFNDLLVTNKSVGMSKDMGKRSPQIYCIKMNFFFDPGFIAIGVAMAT